MTSRAAAALRAVLFYALAALLVLVPALGLLGELRTATALALLALGLYAAGRWLSHASPTPMPYFMRGVLELPRGPHAPRHLARVLRPATGERILEIGPGVGVHALGVAPALVPGGTLHGLDVQRQMLDETRRRAAARALDNIALARGDAGALPYRDAVFDGAYLVSVLGEVPDAAAALGELRRVLKAGARLVICELAIDPDFVGRRGLEHLAASAGFALERVVGPAFAYSALLRPRDWRPAEKAG